MCQQRGCDLKRVDTRQYASKDTRRYASKDAGLGRGWIGRSHIDWRRERVSARTLGPKGVDWEVSHRLEKGISVRERTS